MGPGTAGCGVMSALIVETPATVTAWSVAHALDPAHPHAVLIAGPVDEHARQAQTAEDRTRLDGES